LLALLGQGLEQRGGQAFHRCVSVDHDAVRVLEACGQSGACRPCQCQL
jgi:hypothetical protein